MPALGGLLLGAALAVQQPPVFGTAVDVVAVDASVHDAGGAPVRGLGPEDFTVTIDGKPRRVLSAEFVDLGGGAAAPEPPPKAADFSTNQGLRRGRLMILAVDQGQIGAGQGRTLIRSADSLLDQLTPADRIGLFAFPAPAPPGIEPTADHQKVRAALEGLVGRAPRIGSGRISLTEALGQLEGHQLAWQDALARECPSTLGENDRQICQADLESQAMMMTSDMRQRSAASLGSLRALFDGLAGIEGSKSVVLITEGLWTEHPGDIRQLADRAAAARVTLYVLQLDSPRMPDASVARPSETALDDDALRANPLASLAQLSRGAVFRSVGSGAGVFERIARELSGHYVLGVEPEDPDRDGREHSIRVQLGRKGLSIRARGRVAIPRPGSGPTLEQQLAATLRSPFAETSLLLRATSYRLGGHGGPLRLLVAAEVLDAKAAPLGYALQLVDEKGRASATIAQRIDTLGPSPVAFTTTIAAPAGQYTLRLAVVDAAGRRGSLERPVELSLARAGSLETSDILIGRPPAANAAMEAGVDVTASASGLAAHLELYGRRFDGVSVTFEVTEPQEGPALLSVPGRLFERAEGERAAQMTLPTDLLPPGDYLLRAVVQVDGRAQPVSGRPFHVAPAAAVAGSGVGLSFEAVRPALPRFERALLLKPEVVGHFLDRMRELVPAPLTPALEQAIVDARAGEMERVGRALSGAPSADARVSFLRGVAQLAPGGSLAQATAFLRDAVHASSALMPATVYLGACLAANGEDREAAGAWQTSLLSESGSALVYGLLADALMRADEPARAGEIVNEALESWPEDEAMKRRLGILAARQGELDRALELLGARVEKHPDDAGALFLTLRLLLQSLSTAQTKDALPEQRERALRYARAYVAARGPEQQLVAGWLRYLEKPGRTPSP